MSRFDGRIESVTPDAVERFLWLILSGPQVFLRRNWWSLIAILFIYDFTRRTRGYCPCQAGSLLWQRCNRVSRGCFLPKMFAFYMSAHIWPRNALSFADLAVSKVQWYTFISLHQRWQAIGLVLCLALVLSSLAADPFVVHNHTLSYSYYQSQIQLQGFWNYNVEFPFYAISARPVAS